ncbi:hypothetical protein E2986_06522 [Frieseomelitta varia]|uniref:Testicular haploid expressed protein n=1 Tax=Frieseomelitta varia TaxID=561572 RepID=A0A833SB97_9HYME|nr:hypothetical protein E2986_06522 [Frieseomelitta varia]
MLKDRIKYAMGHLSHKQYVSLLAKPNWRRIQTRNVHILGSTSTVRADPSENARGQSHETHPGLGAPYKEVARSLLSLRSSSEERINELLSFLSSLPLSLIRLLLANMRIFPSSSGNIAETLWKVQNSRYRRYRFFCNARQQREMRKKQKIMAKLRRAIKPEQWDQHVELLEILAAPKVPPKPRFPRKRRWRPVNMRRIEELSTPVTREMPRARDPFKVARTALTYKISKRTQKIAYSKTMAEITPPRILGAVSPAALRAVASPRTVTLAKPVERPAGIETDLREDAFTVSPMALKAKCSKRLKFLARPKRRRFLCER